MAGLLTGLAAATSAAPLDALLTARPTEAGRGAPSPRLELEAGGDLANDQVDVLGLRRGSAYEGTGIGDYHGSHLKLNARHGPWQAELGGWQRRLRDRDNTHRIHSWQTALQWRLDGADDGTASPGTAWALRASAWGSRAGQLSRRTGAGLQVEDLDAGMTELRLHGQRDLQTQFDLIGSRDAFGLRWSGFVGGGRSRVRNDAVSASGIVGGCPYAFNFAPGKLVATPDASCGDALIFVIPSHLMPYDAAAETTWRARWMHAGGSLRWVGEQWTLALGYEFQQWQRNGIDALITARGGTAYRRNHTLVGEVGWSPQPALRLLLRGQLMQHQWLGELPMAYNTQTATHFAQRHGLVTAGVQLVY